MPGCMRSMKPLSQWRKSDKRLRKHIFYDVVEEDDTAEFYNGIVDIIQIKEISSWKTQSTISAVLLPLSRSNMMIFLR